MIQIDNNIIGNCISELRGSDINEIYLVCGKDAAGNPVLLPVNGSQELVESVQGMYTSEVERRPGLSVTQLVDEHFVNGGYRNFLVGSGNNFNRCLVNVNDVLIDIQTRVLDPNLDLQRIAFSRVNAGLIMGSLEDRVTMLEGAFNRMIQAFSAPEQAQAPEAERVIQEATQGAQAVIGALDGADEPVTSTAEVIQDAEKAQEAEEAEAPAVKTKGRGKQVQAAEATEETAE